MAGMIMLSDDLYWRYSNALFHAFIEAVIRIHPDAQISDLYQRDWDLYKLIDLEEIQKNDPQLYAKIIVVFCDVSQSAANGDILATINNRELEDRSQGIFRRAMKELYDMLKSELDH